MFRHKRICIAGAMWLSGMLAASAYAQVSVTDPDDAVDGEADIRELWADSDGTNIYVELVLDGQPGNKVKYRMHFDYKDGLATDNPDCLTTSDDTSKLGGPHLDKQTGPGSWNDDGTLSLFLTVPYTDLDGVAAGDDVFIWADTHRRGIQDRAPDTYGDDGCSKPQLIGEVLVLTLGGGGGGAKAINGDAGDVVLGSQETPASTCGVFGVLSFSLSLVGLIGLRLRSRRSSKWN
jgi:hypothetical protein